MTTSLPSREDLGRLVAQRPTSLFESDMKRHAAAVAEMVEGRRVLVVGGAGSIGSATVREVMRFAPRELHVVDVDENSLAELVRSLRSDGLVPPGTTVRLTPADFGSHLMHRLLRETEPYDLVLNFAALKHVRSEKDVYSMLRMLEVNVVAARRLLGWLMDRDVPRYFAVSTDKAANPVNVMGGTKRAMELVMLDQRVTQSVTSARFANVAFSNGSLLDGWLHRLEKRQPLSVPEATRRYFVTGEESGQLCLLAATVASDRTIVIPDFDPAIHLRDLVEVAEQTLGHLGLEPVWCTAEEEARALMPPIGSGWWPVLLTPLDTTGEKAFEEFAGTGDRVQSGQFARLKSLQTQQPSAAAIDEFLACADKLLLTDKVVSSQDVVGCLRQLVPEFAHNRSEEGLDSRM